MGYIGFILKSMYITIVVLFRSIFILNVYDDNK